MKKNWDWHGNSQLSMLINYNVLDSLLNHVKPSCLWFKPCILALLECVDGWVQFINIKSAWKWTGSKNDSLKWIKFTIPKKSAGIWRGYKQFSNKSGLCTEPAALIIWVGWPSSCVCLDVGLLPHNLSWVQTRIPHPPSNLIDKLSFTSLYHKLSHCIPGHS